MTTTSKLTVRYAETDKMGIVHHSNYPVWFEVGRTDFIRQTGVTYSEMEARGVLLPLYEIVCRYKKPARYEDEIDIVTSLKELSCVRIVLAYQVRLTKDGTLLAEGETHHAMTDAGLKPLNAEKAIPDIYEKLKAAQN